MSFMINVLHKTAIEDEKHQFIVCEETMTSEELEVEEMNLGEINTRGKNMNATMSNDQILGDIDRDLFTPLDYHISFNDFTCNS